MNRCYQNNPLYLCDFADIYILLGLIFIAELRRQMTYLFLCFLIHSTINYRFAKQYQSTNVARMYIAGLRAYIHKYLHPALSRMELQQQLYIVFLLISQIHNSRRYLLHIKFINCMNKWKASTETPIFTGAQKRYIMALFAIIYNNNQSRLYDLF